MSEWRDSGDPDDEEDAEDDGEDSDDDAVHTHCVMSVCTPAEANVAPVAVALDAVGMPLASVALPYDRDAVVGVLAEFMYNYPPEVVILNLQQGGGKNNFIAGAVDAAWKDRVCVRVCERECQCFQTPSFVVNVCMCVCVSGARLCVLSVFAICSLQRAFACVPRCLSVLGRRRS